MNTPRPRRLPSALGPACLPEHETTGRRWVSLEDAARYIGTSEKTVRRMIAAGDLPAYRMGVRLIRIDMADIDALMVPMEPTP